MQKKTNKQVEDESALLAAIATMSNQDRPIAEQLHKIITSNAPQLMPRTWYGMPAYSDGNKVLCYFRDRKKFGERFLTLGFNDVAKLDEGNMWPIVYAITELTDEEEVVVAKLVKKAVRA